NTKEPGARSIHSRAIQECTREDSPCRTGLRLRCEETVHGASTGGAAALTAYLHLPADADHDDVDCPSHHGGRSLFRDAVAGLVAARRSLGPECLFRDRRVYEFLDRSDRAVRLYLDADAPHAGRDPAPDLGYRPWLR